MKFLYTVFLSLCLVFWSSCGSVPESQTKPRTDSVIKPKKKTLIRKEGVYYPTMLIKGTDNAFVDAVGRGGDTVYYSTYKGQIYCSDTLGKNRQFLFDLKAEFMVDKVFISSINGDSVYFVNWQETDHERVRTHVAVYKKGAAKPEWKRIFNVPNPGKAAIDSSYAYVTALGMAGKLKLTNGDFVWVIDSLYTNISHVYQAFEPVIVLPEQIMFIDLPLPGRRTKRDTLRVNPTTGERVK
jgi:hypothetical protein